GERAAVEPSECAREERGRGIDRDTELRSAENRAELAEPSIAATCDRARLKVRATCRVNFLVVNSDRDVAVRAIAATPSQVDRLIRGARSERALLDGWCCTGVRVATGDPVQRGSAKRDAAWSWR